MPPDFPTWFFYAVAGAIVVWTVPKAWAYLIAALGKAIAESIGHSLGMPDVTRRLAAIENQLKPNGGESLHDRIIRVEQAVHTLNLNTGRFDPPEGTPA